MTSNDGDTLYAALQTGHLELFQYLIQKGILVFHVAEGKTNCLHISAMNGHLELCEILLETYKLDIHLADDKGLTALHHAAASGNFELFQYLIRKGSDPFCLTKDNCNSLYIAALKGHLDICRTLLENYNLDVHLRYDGG